MTETTQSPAITVGALNADLNGWARYRQIQRNGSLARSEEYGGFWTLLSYDAVREAATDTEKFSSAQGVTIPVFGNPLPAYPLELDPPAHRAYRKVLVPALRPDQVNQWAGDIRAVTTECIDRFADRGTADLKAELAAIVPPSIIARILGLPADDVGKFVGWTRTMLMAAARGDREANMAAAGALMKYIEEQVARCRATADDSLLSVVANAVIDGEPISREAAMGMVLVLVVAGHETTVNGIASALWMIGKHPQVKDQLLADPGLIPAAVEETLRIESPVSMMARTVAQDTEFGGAQLKAGDRVALMFGAGNHDEDTFDEPDAFQLNRSGAAHLAFGHGVHRCIGEHLARLEMSIVIEEVLNRIPDYGIAADVAIGDNSLTNRGPRAVPVAFTPAGAAADRSAS
ncbi:cytochrome P450 [Arthrobacter sp. I2-34]|uniref:Cytochrome P450 n=1 Tax=Arthrobacter hankyongi TaxID=2904801 RepID=A0ABS9L3T7_9MICC|nr:cytochrome P450 [Arthrobacter hankyongi]MCG2621323.1 cytochrome P450 [Arthrobacter hankyongi]